MQAMEFKMMVKAFTVLKSSAPSSEFSSLGFPIFKHID